MKTPSKALLAALAVAAIAAFILVRWPQPEAPPADVALGTIEVAPPLAPVTPPVVAEPLPGAPTIKPPVDALAAPAPDKPKGLPNLENADGYVREVLDGLLGAKDALQFLQTSGLVRHLVATVDNLPRASAPARMWPVNPMPGRFSVGDTPESTPLGPATVNPNNAQRYRPFVGLIESIDTAKAVVVYIHLYPLFEQAYAELGYPKAYFNDRLVAVIDHLLTTPIATAPLEVSRVEVKGPYQAVRPWVTYEFTDPALRAMSAGQKMLLRTGAANHQRLRTKLLEVRAQLTSSALAKPSALAPK